MSEKVVGGAVGVRKAGRQALPRTYGYAHARATYTGAETRTIGPHLTDHTTNRKTCGPTSGNTGREGSQRKSVGLRVAQADAIARLRAAEGGERRAATPLERAPFMRDVCAAGHNLGAAHVVSFLHTSLGEDARPCHEPHAGSKPGCE